MKPKKAINVLRWAFNQLEGKHYIKDGFGTIDASAKVDAFEMAIVALEQAEKYRWHDLRKNPDDLPTVETKVEVCCKYKNIGYKTYTHGLYEDGTVLEKDSIWCWYDIDGEYDEEHDCRIIPEGWWEYSDFLVYDIHNNVIDAEVLAWRYIEPFEGSDKE